MGVGYAYVSFADLVASPYINETPKPASQIKFEAHHTYSVTEERDKRVSRKRHYTSYNILFNIDFQAS